MTRRTRMLAAATSAPIVLGALITAVMLALGEERSLTGSLHFAWLALVVGAALSAGGAGVVLLLRSHARRADAALQRASAAHREDHRRFLSRLDHELKNPLTAIRVGVATIDAESFETAAQGIATQAQRLSRLLGDLRKLSEVQAMPLESAEVDIEAVAAEAVEIAQELPETANRVFAVSFPRAPRPLPAVSGDIDLLFLALYNLISNAVKYSAAGDRIELRGSEDDGAVVLEIADTGRGIPPEEHAVVWEELARGADAHDVAGSGLGLPFVRAIIERHGGTIGLRSRLGEGTVVKIRLPAASARPTERSAR